MTDGIGTSLAINYEEVAVCINYEGYNGSYGVDVLLIFYGSYGTKENL